MAAAFISASSLFPASIHHVPLQSSFVVRRGSRALAAPQPRLAQRRFTAPGTLFPICLNNSRPPTRRRSRSRSHPPRAFPPRTPSEALYSAQLAWRETPLPLQLLSILAVSAALNVVLHVSAALGALLFPLLLAPLLITMAASMLVVACVVAVFVGVGFVAVGSPLFVMAFLAKALVPVVIVAGVLSTLASRVFRMGVGRASRRSLGDEVDDHGGEEDGDEVDGGYDARVDDELEEFDRVLRRRTGAPATGGGARGRDVRAWGMDEVVDELDATGLGRYRQLFIEERIDGHTLLSLSEDDIRVEFADSMPLGDRRRLSKLVADLRRLTVGK